ncbi:MAG: hypothetical protein GY892_03375 [Shimia sp.]|nr:hypothetical protein [Shimia sp.]
MRGFTLLLQSFRLIFGNLSQSLRLSSPLVAVLVAALVMFGPSYFIQDVDPTSANALPVGALLCQLLTLVVTMWVAVAWHRFVLLEEYPTGALPAFHGGRVLAYFGYGILLGLVVGFATLLMGTLVGLALFWAPVLMLAGIMIVAISGGWAFYRLSPILLAAAIGKNMQMKEAWAATKPLSGPILGAMIVFVVTIFALAFLGALIGSVIPILGGLFLLAFNWLYILLGVSFLTTLYGVAVEGRSID